MTRNPSFDDDDYDYDVDVDVDGDDASYYNYLKNNKLLLR